MLSEGYSSVFMTAQCSAGNWDNVVRLVLTVDPAAGDSVPDKPRAISCVLLQSL